jgi:hypothetical protein
MQITIGTSHSCVVHSELECWLFYWVTGHKAAHYAVEIGISWFLCVVFICLFFPGHFGFLFFRRFSTFVGLRLFSIAIEEFSFAADASRDIITTWLRI